MQLIQNHGRHFGYARVSSKEQNLDLQIAHLKDKGIQDSFLYTEKISGVKKEVERPEFQKLLNRLDEGDTLHLYKLDRLSRDFKQLQRLIQTLQNKKVTLVSSDLPELDTGNDAMNSALFNIMISLLGVMAQIERDNMKERQRLGIEEAKKRGAYKGKTAKYSATSSNKKGRIIHAKIVEMLSEGISIRMTARECGVGVGTVAKIKKELESI